MKKLRRTPRLTVRKRGTSLSTEYLLARLSAEFSEPRADLKPKPHWDRLYTTRGQLLLLHLWKQPLPRIKLWYKARGHKPRGKKLHEMRDCIARELYLETILAGPMPHDSRFDGFFL